MKKELQKNIVPFLLFALVILIDQLSKYIIRQSGGFYICNSGIAFGINPVFILVVLFCIIVFWSIGRKFSLKSTADSHRSSVPNDKLLATGNWLSMTFVLAGGLSNLIDRISFGCVIDFIDLRFWPVFNLADVSISLGATIIITKILLKK